jgi:hypothetical protein
MPQDEDWKILAEQAAQEQDPKKLIEIINSLTAAIDQSLPSKAARREPVSSKKAESSSQVDLQSQSAKFRSA